MLKCLYVTSLNNTRQDFEVKHSIDEKWAGSSQLLENNYNIKKTRKSN